MLIFNASNNRNHQPGGTLCNLHPYGTNVHYTLYICIIYKCVCVCVCVYHVQMYLTELPLNMTHTRIR